MRNGYKILWTNHALSELEKIFEYLEINFSEKELKRLAQKIESITAIIAQNPKLFPLSDKKEIHRVSILKFNTMYYRVRMIGLKYYHFSQIAKARRKENYNKDPLAAGKCSVPVIARNEAITGSIKNEE